TGSKKRTSKARTGSKADRNPTPSAPNTTKRFGRRITHSHGGNSRQPLGFTVLHAPLLQIHFDPVQNTEKFQGLRINARTDTAFSFSRLLPALPSQQGSPCQSHLSGKDRSAPTVSRRSPHDSCESPVVDPRAAIAAGLACVEPGGIPR